MIRIIKWFSIIVILAIGIFYAIYANEVNYGLRQLKGQIKIITNTIPINEVLDNSTFPDSLKSRIELIEEIKKFTVDSLGLNPSTSYQTYYDQKGEPILWVISACPPYSLENKVWNFPIAGEFSYKGHFEKQIALDEVETLKMEGFDVRLSEVSAWSTLGYLSDPILSSMLRRKPGALAALIIHELTHGTLFVKNDLEFNENLADFIGDQGALLFLESKYGKDSKEYKEYKIEKSFNEAFGKHISKGIVKLDSLFQTFSPEMSSNKKDSLKYDLIDEIMISSESIKGNLYKYKGRGSINNAFFTAYSVYQGKQNEFDTILKRDFNNNFKAYLAHLEETKDSLGK
jgi:predicted aminopeptidase